MRASTCALLILSVLAPASAQVRSVELTKPRLFGYYIGDLVADEISIAVEPGVTLKPSSLPAPGPLNYWLNLRSIQTATKQSADGGTNYVLTLTYQTFYDPLEPHWLKVPGFELVFDKSGQSVSAAAPEWSFLSSPIREVSPQESKDNAYIQPDIPPYLRDPSLAREEALGAGLLALGSYLVLAHGRAWPPFRLRPRRPFTDAARRLDRAIKAGTAADPYRQALTFLHEAFNETEGGVILADDLDAFLKAHPPFQAARRRIELFFAASRRTFFSSDPAGAMSDFPLAAIVALASELSAAERGLR